jgi:hypothetical protein
METLYFQSVRQLPEKIVPEFRRCFLQGEILATFLDFDCRKNVQAAFVAFLHAAARSRCG